MIKNPSTFQCRGYEFHPWPWNKDPTCCRATSQLEKPHAATKLQHSQPKITEKVRFERGWKLVRSLAKRTSSRRGDLEEDSTEATDLEGERA